MSNENNNKKDQEININHYNPDHERCCQGCYKALKTKEGILENRYDFTCGPCHNWYKKRNWIIGGIFITFLIILIIGYVFAEIYFKSKCYED